MRQIHREGVVRSGALERAPPTTWHMHTHTICMPDRGDHSEIVTNILFNDSYWIGTLFEKIWNNDINGNAISRACRGYSYDRSAGKWKYVHKQIFAKGLFSSHCPMSTHGAGRLGETGAGTREPCLVQLGRAEQRSSSETLFAEECDARSPLRRDAVTLDAETRDAGITPPLSRMDGQHYQCACWELGTTWILYCWQNEKFQKSFSFIVPDSFTC